AVATRTILRGASASTRIRTPSPTTGRRKTTDARLFDGSDWFRRLARRALARPSRSRGPRAHARGRCGGPSRRRAARPRGRPDRPSAGRPPKAVLVRACPREGALRGLRSPRLVREPEGLPLVAAERRALECERGARGEARRSRMPPNRDGGNV